MLLQLSRQHESLKMLAEVIVTPVASHALLMGPSFMGDDVSGCFPVAVTGMHLNSCQRGEVFGYGRQ